MVGAPMLLIDEEGPKSQGHMSSYKKRQRTSTLNEALKGTP